MIAFGRSDTYINVYLPREDGILPRQYDSPSSPVFNSNVVYKFSDQIVKDRKLFLGRKQTSLYEIYYKDNKESEDHSEEIGYKSDDNAESDDYETVQRRTPRRNKGPVELPHVSKLSISLDNRIRPQRTSVTRFNESFYTYGTQKGPVNTTPKYDPNQNLDRQVTSYDYMHMTNRRRVTSQTIKHSRDKIQNISRLFKKAQSAPSEFRQVRSLGLPPISRSNTALTNTLPSICSSRAPTTASNTKPIRPSSKPHKIWQQTTNALTTGYESSSSIAPGIKQMKLSSSRSRHNGSTVSDYMM